MLLLIDVGNTRIKWAYHAQEVSAASTLRDSGSLREAVLGEIDRVDFAQLALLLPFAQIERVLISNVAGADLQAQLEALLLTRYPEAAIRQFHALPSCAGLQNCYQYPEKLGSDRFASSIAARHLFPEKALIVATCGTATTIDCVSAQAQFLGGMILPGLQTMASSLARNTAQLPEILQGFVQTSVPTAFALETQQAIRSGCILAQTGAIHAALKQMAELSGEVPILLISGGAAAYLKSSLDTSLCDRLEHIDNLVLMGLLVVAQYGETDVAASSAIFS